jgi:thiosulfate/3-mercaptopyruvate sulfurtransferase
MQAVVYDRQGANYCGRLWWMLKWVGHERAAVLDGGLAGLVRGGWRGDCPARVRTTAQIPLWVTNALRWCY